MSEILEKKETKNKKGNISRVLKILMVLGLIFLICPSFLVSCGDGNNVTPVASISLSGIYYYPLLTCIKLCIKEGESVAELLSSLSLNSISEYVYVYMPQALLVLTAPVISLILICNKKLNEKIKHTGIAIIAIIELAYCIFVDIYLTKDATGKLFVKATAPYYVNLIIIMLITILSIYSAIMHRRRS